MSAERISATHAAAIVELVEGFVSERDAAEAENVRLRERIETLRANYESASNLILSLGNLLVAAFGELSPEQKDRVNARHTPEGTEG